MKTDAQAIKVEGESKTDVFNKKDNMVWLSDACATIIV
jgi:hypothetical protein